MTILYLVRHAAVTLRPEAPGHSWHLSPGGRAAADAIGQESRWKEVSLLFTSPEAKAVATAQRIAAPHGLRIEISPDLREVGGRPWTDGDYTSLVRRYLEGEPLDHWEPSDHVSKRVCAAIGSIVAGYPSESVGVVSHGLALTLYLSSLQKSPPAAALELWSSIRMPDVAVIRDGRIQEPFGT
jgi:broad specificity phosphatase PhoE